LTLKNAHLRRQDCGFEPQRTKKYASAQILVLPCTWAFLSVNLGFKQQQSEKLAEWNSEFYSALHIPHLKGGDFVG
jgi:hypothetical protein